MLYVRRKVGIATAMQVPEVEDTEAWAKICIWLRETKTEWVVLKGNAGISFRGEGSRQTAQRGDWIVREVNNELIAYRDDILLTLYDEVSTQVDLGYNYQGKLAASMSERGLTRLDLGSGMVF